MTASRFHPIVLSSQLHAELKRRILTCELRPGERLVEKNLCESLGVSRASLREALSRLAQERLVTQRPNAGFHVTPITSDSFRNLCELRRTVESQVAALAARRSTADQIELMRGVAGLDVDPADPDAYRVYVDANFAFHSAVARASGNPLLEEIVIGALEKDMQPIYYGIDLEVCTNPGEISREHHGIVDAVERGDADEAHRLMASHIGRKEDRIVNAAAPPSDASEGFA